VLYVQSLSEVEQRNYLISCAPEVLNTLTPELRTQAEELRNDPNLRQQNPFA